MQNRNRFLLFSLPSGLLKSLGLCLPIVAGTLLGPGLAEESRLNGTDANQPPLWSFAWVSDMHMSASNLEYTARALRYIDVELKPHFVLFTGDNNAHPAPPVDRDAPESIGLRRQRFLKAFLEEHLRTPYAIIPGDNWPQEFDKVFGPKQYSFDFSYRASDDRFEMQDRLQHIDIPPPLRDELAAPAQPGFVMHSYEALPARPLVEDPSLENRAGELLLNAVRSLLPSNPEPAR